MQENITENNLAIKIKRFFSFLSYSVLVIMGLLLLGAVNHAAKVAGAFDVSKKHNVDLQLNSGVKLVSGVPEHFSSTPFPINRASEMGAYAGHWTIHKNEGQFSGFIYALTNDAEAYMNSGIDALSHSILLASPYNFFYYATSVREKMR